LLTGAGGTKTRRAEVEIEIHILQVVRDNGLIGPTRIMMLANLSYQFMLGYVETLMAAKCLDSRMEKESVKYFLTPWGLETLEMLETGMRRIKPLRPVFPVLPILPVSKPDYFTV
jgi:predicted transcriptional regulator